MNIAISTNSIWNFIKFRKGLAKSLQNEGFKIFLLSKNNINKKKFQKILSLFKYQLIEAQYLLLMTFY